MCDAATYEGFLNEVDPPYLTSDSVPKVSGLLTFTGKQFIMMNRYEKF